MHLLPICPLCSTKKQKIIALLTAEAEYIDHSHPQPSHIRCRWLFCSLSFSKRINTMRYAKTTVRVFFISRICWLGCVQQLLTGTTLAVCTDTETSTVPDPSFTPIATLPVEPGPAYVPPGLQGFPGIIPVVGPPINIGM